MDRRLFTLALGAALGYPAGGARASAAFAALRADAEPLRGAFNRDAHKTRIVMLVSPT